MLPRSRINSAHVFKDIKGLKTMSAHMIFFKAFRIK